MGSTFRWRISKQNSGSKVVSLRHSLTKGNKQFNNLKQQQVRLISLINPLPSLSSYCLPVFPLSFCSLSIGTFVKSSTLYPGPLPFSNDILRTLRCQLCLKIHPECHETDIQATTEFKPWTNKNRLNYNSIMLTNGETIKDFQVKLKNNFQPHSGVK